MQLKFRESIIYWKYVDTVHLAKKLNNSLKLLIFGGWLKKKRVKVILDTLTKRQAMPYVRKFGLSTPLINQIFVYHSPTDAAPQFL